MAERIDWKAVMAAWLKKKRELELEEFRVKYPTPMDQIVAFNNAFDMSGRVEIPPELRQGLMLFDEDGLIPKEISPDE